MLRMSELTNKKIDSMREKILDAAWGRLAHYGLNKTTMVEIANDCDMSAANLYRYFKNKNEIATACCNRAIIESSAELRKVVKTPNLNAKEKLKLYAIRLTELNRQRSEGDNVGELVVNMTTHNADLIYKKISDHHSRIAEILAQGNANSEFDIDDIVKSAETVYTSLVVFDVPLFADLFSAEKYREMASEVVDLLISGLSNNHKE